MKKTIHIQGMTCGQCTLHVKAGLKQIKGIKVIDVNLHDQIAIAEIPDTISDDQIKKAVSSVGYEVTNIVS